ncbi:Zinc finger protein 91 [Larimichthys crocea]|uniref:Uncharacterized protein n=1 Tax=Larimichthys crocea TaxID=215358 RepID=A0ACD3QXN2_LARCR|nr:Zinc finger protein 91 [Larimichthys crocea]
MAEWDSYFHNLPPLSSDPSTLRRTSESEESISQQIENFIGHHDFPGTVASHEALATNSKFNKNLYSNHNVGNSSSDCQRSYKETLWQGDGEQMEEDFLPRCGNGDIDFATDGLSTSESFPPSFAADLQGVKQGCEMPSTSLLENYSDVSSCSDADVGEAKSSCRFMASNSVPKPKTDITLKQSSSDRLTCTGKTTLTTENPCPNMSETNVILPSPSNVKAVENIVECAQGKTENPENPVRCYTGHTQSLTASMVTTTGSETAVDRNSDGCQDRKQKDNVGSDGIEIYPDGNDKEQITATAANIMTTIDNEQDNLDKKVLRKEIKKSSGQKEGFENPNSTDGQDMKEDEKGKSQVLEGERKELGSVENENFDKQKSQNPNSTHGQHEYLETVYPEKEIQSNTSQSLPSIKMSDCEDATHELKECTSTLKSNSHDVRSDGLFSEDSDKNGQSVASHSEPSLGPNGLNTDVNLCREKKWTSSPEKKTTTSPTDRDCSGPVVTSDKEQEGTFSAEKTNTTSPDPSCNGPQVTDTDINPYLEKEMTSPPEKKTTIAPTDPDYSGPVMTRDHEEQECTSTLEKKNVTTSPDLSCNGSSVTSESLSLDTCHKNKQDIASHTNSGLQPDGSYRDLNSCLEKERKSPVENTKTTATPDQQQSLHQSSVALEPESLGGDVENTRESFEELETSTEEPTDHGILYGEPLSTEDSSCDTYETKVDTSQCKDTSLAVRDYNSMNHLERQAPQLKSSIQMRKHLQPVVIVETLEPINELTNSYHCAGCQHTTNNVDHLIEHHHCCHSVCNFQFCKTCNLYLMSNDQTEKHFCGVTKKRPLLPSESSLPKKRHYGRHHCTRCGLIFSKILHYVKHMRTHTGKTPFKCVDCGLYFAQPASLQRHKRVPGRCKKANLPLSNSDAVISKTKTSTQKDLAPNEPYANLPDCYVKLVDICKTNLWSVFGKTFTTAERPKKEKVQKEETLVSLNSCTTKLSGEKRKEENETTRKYQCPLCPRLFKYSYNRARHLRDCIKVAIRGGKEKISGKYRCPLCRGSFTSTSSRYRHIKTSCFRECINRLAKEKSRESIDQKKTKEIEQKCKSTENEQKTFSKEFEQKKQAPPALTAPKPVPRYKCNHCPAVFCHASGKYRHMKKHELFKLTGKIIRYRNSAFSTTSKPVTLSDEKTEDSKENLESTEENVSLALSCHFCGKGFSKSQSLKKHERKHRGERPYRCLECGKSFKKRAYLIGHKIVHQRRIQCTVCKKILPTVGELIQHRSSHLKKGMLQCPDCHQQFQYPAHLLRHLVRHKNRKNKATRLEEKPQLKPEQSFESVKEQNEPKQVKCSLCKEVFNDAQVLRKHCLTHISGSSSNQCPFCKVNFSNRRYLLRHMIKHTGDKPFSCANCGKQFYRNLYLKLHSQKCLPAQTRDPVTFEFDIKTKGPHHCSYCPRVFSKKIRLISHLRGHKIGSLLLCSRCGQYFGHRKLKQHQNKNCLGEKHNTGLSPNSNISKSTTQTSQKVQEIASQSNATKLLQFKCPHCTKRFRFRSILLRHLVSHTGVQPYACEHCGHRFGTQSMCLQHEAFCDGVYREEQSKSKSGMPALRESGKKPQTEGEAEYKCKFCTKTFMKSRSLRRHILTHNEVKPYRCKACDSCFSRYDHLKVHQTRCKGKRSRLEVCIPKISLDDVGKGWKNRFGIESSKQPTYECKVCSRSFPTQSKLSRHNTMFHTIKLFKCAGCGSGFSHEKSLKKHRQVKKCRKVSKETNASLTQGTDSLTENVTEPVRNRALQRIQPHFNKKYKFICSYCPRTFGNSWQLGVHTRLHTGERPFSCDFCGQSFIRKDYVQRHYPKCTKKKQQTSRVLCDRCGGFFPQGKLENHKKSCISTPSSKSTNCQSQQTDRQQTSQNSPKGFSCAYCSSRFLLFSQLQEHFLNAHRMETEVPLVSTAPLQDHLSNIPNIKEEPLDESCDDRVSDGAALIHKLDTALDREVPKPFSCPECNTSFVSKAGLIGHLRVHTLQQPFNCKTCKRGFWNKSLLRNHYRKCRFGHISRKNTTQQLEAPLSAEIDFALNDSVLVFEEGSKTTGTGVLQTNFSCKDDFMDDSSQTSEGNEMQSSSSKEKKAVQYQCSECDQSFTDGLMLISHLEDHGRQEQEKKRNTCTKCGRVCMSPGNLEKHMKWHGIEKTHSCPDCNSMFYNTAELEVHRTCHESNRPHACKLCNQRFWTRQTLCNHYSEDHPDDVYNCRFCNKTYAVKKSLTRHYKKWHQNELKDEVSTVQKKNHTEQQSSSQVSTADQSDEDEDSCSKDSDSDSAPYFPCHVCGKTFPTSESLEDHQRCHLGEKPHECAECGRCFYQASQLQQHQRMHKSEFQCQACGRGFVSLFALRKHKHTHGKSRPYRCSKCHFSFTGPTQLAEHMSTHREENFPCDICNRVFRSKSSRAEHRISHSKSGDRLPPSVSKEEPKMSERSSVLNKELKYRCGVCSERFRDPEQLSEHGCMAAKERPYSCSDCDKHFLHASHLKKHRTTHQKLWTKREYPCNQCNNSFSSSQHFLSHLKNHLHTAAKIKCEAEVGGLSHSFICPVCQECFVSATELIVHFSTHPEGIFECKFCEMKFSSGDKLKEHERHHLTTTSEFECTKCGQSFLGSVAYCEHRCSHQLHAVK